MALVGRGFFYSNVASVAFTMGIVNYILCEWGDFTVRIYKAKDYADMSRKAANIVSAQVIMKPNCVLGLATGSTPIGLYKQLVEWFKKGDLDFSEVMTVNLDEYKGLSRENDQSYYYFMHRLMMCQSRHTRWESRPLCRPRRFL